VVERVAAALAGWRLGGFLTRELRHEGVRRGFALETFDGRRAVLAHVDLPKRARVGRYGVDLGALEAVAAALDPAAPVDAWLVDEIGPMECLCPAFVAAIRRLAAGPAPLVATVARRGGGFIAEVKRWPGAELWEVTTATRDALPARVLAWLAAHRR